MERYDGKTRRDDYIKYGLIALAAVVLVVGLCLLSHYVKKANQTEPDYTVVIGSEEAFNEAMLDQLENVFAKLVGDRNGDGDTVVKVEALRLTDYAQAKADEAQAREAYDDAVAAGESAALEDQFAGLTMDGGFNQMLLHMTEKDCYLYLLSDQPRGEFRGAATAYAQEGYFLELPEDMRDAASPYRMDLTNAGFLTELGLEDIPFYGLVLDGGDSGAEEYAIELLRQLRDARASIF